MEPPAGLLPGVRGLDPRLPSRSDFWDDWGLPALMVLLALDLDLFLQLRLPADSVRRWAVTGGLAATVFLTATNDANSRWSGQRKAGDYLSE